jgi:hypothetical protein
VRTLVLWLAAAPFAWARGRKCETNALVASCGHTCNKATCARSILGSRAPLSAGSPLCPSCSTARLHLSCAAALEPHRGSGIVVQQPSWVAAERRRPPLVHPAPLSPGERASDRGFFTRGCGERGWGAGPRQALKA